jgi:hypothetical protein
LRDLVLRVAVHQVVGPLPEDVGAEDARRAVEVPAVELEQGVELVVGLPEELCSIGPGPLAAERVVLLGEGVVDPVGLRLVEQRHACRQGVGEATPDRPLEVDVVVGAVGRPNEAVEVLRGLSGFELDHAGRSVAPEERPLRPAQDLGALQVEQGLPLHHRVLEHHLVDHHRDGLRGVEVEVGVAEPADVEARKGATEGRLEQQARHPRREGLDVSAARGQKRELISVEGRQRKRNLLDVFLALLGRDRDFLEELRPLFGLRGWLGRWCLGLLVLRLLSERETAWGQQGRDCQNGEPRSPTRRVDAHLVLLVSGPGAEPSPTTPRLQRTDTPVEPVP